MVQQKVIFIISETEKDYKVKLEFMPPLAGTEKFQGLSESRKKLQCFASSIASNVMNALNKN